MHLCLVIPILDQIRESLPAILAPQIRLNVILEVLQVIRSRPIQVPAHAAGVIHLQHVPLIVILQCPLIGEGLVALLTRELGRLQMQLLVLLQRLFGHEAVHTTITLELCSASHPMVLECLTPHEDHCADLALKEGPFTVNCGVVLQLPLGQELLVALLAAVFSDGLVVQIPMLDEHVVRVEDSTAISTGKLSRARVSIPDVIQQIRFVHKELMALVTLEAAAREALGSLGNRFDLLRVFFLCRVTSSFVFVDLVHGPIVGGGKCISALIARVLLGGVAVLTGREKS